MICMCLVIVLGHKLPCRRVRCWAIRKLGPLMVRKRIDFVFIKININCFVLIACDPAGIFFDGSGLMRKVLLDRNPRDVRSAAKTVDCWHTSGIYGTKYRLSCDRNWLLGRCGLRQPGSRNTNITSHSFCPIYYNLSFKYYFPAVKQPNALCSVSNPAKYWPDGFKLGYLETRKR